MLNKGEGLLLWLLLKQKLPGDGVLGGELPRSFGPTSFRGPPTTALPIYPHNAKT